MERNRISVIKANHVVTHNETQYEGASKCKNPDTMWTFDRISECSDPFSGESSSSKVDCDFVGMNNLFHLLRKWGIYTNRQSHVAHPLAPVDSSEIIPTHIDSHVSVQTCFVLKLS